MSEHCIVEAPAVIELDKRLQGIRQGRTVIVREDLLLRPENSAVSLGLLGGFRLSLCLDLVKDLALLALVLVRLATTHYSL